MQGRFGAWLPLTLLLALGCGSEKDTGKVGLSLRGASLGEARSRVATQLKVQKPSPEPFDNGVPEGVQAVLYRSGDKELKAWLARPGGAGPFPAVLYCHAGYALGRGDYEAAKKFVDAGFVVLMPSWRGENGNPGNFEMYYGEVDDAVAALDFLASLPEVNAQQLFAAGHDSGGTIVMLLAAISPRLRAAAACGGIPDLRSWVEEVKRPVLDHMPFDWRDPLELDLRSPARHVQDMKCPLQLYYGERQDELYYTQAAKLEIDAEAAGKTVRAQLIPGTDHNTAIDAAVPRMIRFFKRYVDESR